MCVYAAFQNVSFCLLLQCNTYKEQYDAAAKTVKQLQTQLDEVAQLRSAISEAHDAQVSSLHLRGNTAPFSALTQLVRRRKGIQPVKNWALICWWW